MVQKSLHFRIPLHSCHVICQILHVCATPSTASLILKIDIGCMSNQYKTIASSSSTASFPSSNSAAYSYGSTILLSVSRLPAFSAPYSNVYPFMISGTRWLAQLDPNWVGDALMCNFTFS